MECKECKECKECHSDNIFTYIGFTGLIRKICRDCGYLEYFLREAGGNLKGIVDPGPIKRKEERI